MKILQEIRRRRMERLRPSREREFRVILDINKTTVMNNMNSHQLINLKFKSFQSTQLV